MSLVPPFRPCWINAVLYNDEAHPMRILHREPENIDWPECIAMLSNNIREGPCELAALYRSATDLFE